MAYSKVKATISEISSRIVEFQIGCENGEPDNLAVGSTSTELLKTRLNHFEPFKEISRDRGLADSISVPILKSLD